MKKNGPTELSWCMFCRRFVLLAKGGMYEIGAEAQRHACQLAGATVKAKKKPAKQKPPREHLEREYMRVMGNFGRGPEHAP